MKLSRKYRGTSSGHKDVWRPSILDIVVAAGSINIVSITLLISGVADIYPQAYWGALSGAGALLVGIVRSRLGLNWLSPAILYAGIFWLFHFGLVGSLSIVPNLRASLEDYHVDWLSGTNTQIAVCISQLFLSTYLVAFVIAVRSGVPLVPQRLIYEDSGIRAVGFLLVGLGQVVLVFAFVEVGFSLSLSYGDLFGRHNGLSNGVVIVAFGIICLLLGGISVTRCLWLTAVFYIPWALAIALVGIRTGPLFSLAALFAAFTERGLKVSRVLIVLIALAVLTFTSLVREARTHGIATVDKEMAAQAWNPLLGALELGGSLRPVWAVVKMGREDNEPLALGATYWLPFERQLQRLRGLPLPGEWEDRRFVATHVNYAFGSIGFSTTAEAYYNGGWAGVVIFAAIWGAAFGILSGSCGSVKMRLWLYIAFVPMLINIRNSFVFVPGWIAIGGVIVIASGAFSRKRSLASR